MDNFIRSFRNQLAIATGSRSAGSNNVNGASVDIAGYSSAVLMVEFGTIANNAVTSVKIQESDDGSDWTDMAGTEQSVAPAEDNHVVLIEITHPLKRYVRAVVERSTANAAITTARWLLCGYFHEPVKQPDDVITRLVH